MKFIKKALLLTKSIFNSKRSKLSQITTYYGKNYEKLPVDDHLILYETRDGQSITDSPLALFIALSKDKRFEDYHHVWVIENDDENLKINLTTDVMKNVSFVVRNTKEYAVHLLTAKYLITNSTFPTFFLKKSEQVYINTWHGTPLKHMGFDIPENPK